MGELIVIDNETGEVKEEVKEKVETTSNFATMEGFEKEIGVLDKLIDMRSKYVDVIKEDFSKGRLSPKEMRLVNEVVNGLSADVLSKIKNIKDAQLQESKNNNDAALLQIAMGLISQRSNAINKENTGDNVVSIKRLDSFDFSETEINESVRDDILNKDIKIEEDEEE